LDNESLFKYSLSTNTIEQPINDLSLNSNPTQPISHIEQAPVVTSAPQKNESNKKIDDIKVNTITEVKLVSTGGVYEIPVLLNDSLKINVIIDSGAADVSISPDVVLTLLRTGTIAKNDWLEGKLYQFADGSTAKSERFKLKSIVIGDKEFKNVECSIANSLKAPLLLGQSMLRQFGKYTIDYKKGMLILE
jgi:aspartyl protease family protein